MLTVQEPFGLGVSKNDVGDFVARWPGQRIYGNLSASHKAVNVAIMTGFDANPGASLWTGGFDHQGCIRRLPTSRVAHACSRIPWSRHDFIECLLNPDGILLVEVNDRAQRLAVIEVILNISAAGETGDADLNPCVAADHLRFWQAKVFHNPKTLSV